MPQSIIRYRTKPGQADASPILEIRAFGEFQAGIRERCDEPPVAQAFTEVGSYRFLTG